MRGKLRRSAICVLAFLPVLAAAQPPNLELRTVHERSGSISYALTITPPCASKESMPVDIAFVLHGPSEETRTRHSLLAAITLLSARDRIALIDTDAGTPILLPLSRVGFTGPLPAALRIARTNGLPLLFAGLASASAQLAHGTTEGRLQHILVLESFLDEHADEQQLAALGESLKRRGIVVSALTRSGCDISPLRSLISNTGGFCIEAADELPTRIELLKASCAPPLTVVADPSSEVAIELLDFSDLTSADPAQLSVPLARATTVLVHARWPDSASRPASYGSLLVASGGWNSRVILPAPPPRERTGGSQRGGEYQYEGHLP